MKQKTGKIINCEYCKKEVYKSKWQLQLNAKFCSRVCKGDYQNGKNMGKDNPHWKGGIMKHAEGYILIYNPSHPFCNNLRYVFEHRLVMEKHLGRYLNPEEIVHHIDSNRKNNNINNLNLFKNNSEHIKHHHEKIKL